MQEPQPQDSVKLNPATMSPAQITKEAAEKVKALEGDLVTRMNAAIDNDGLNPLTVAQAALFQSAQLMMVLVADNKGSQEVAESVFDQVIANVREKIVVERFSVIQDAIDKMVAAGLKMEAQAANEVGA